MQVIHPRCAGLDVHPDTVAVTILLTASDGTVQKDQLTFGTFTPDLLKLRDWLKSHQVTHVAMESTGAYWKPVWNVLEEGFTLLLVNAQHLKRVPGRKTDVSDSEWIADLLRHGLLRASFVPSRPQRELRELVRHRDGYVKRVGQLKNELQEALESANLKLGRVVTDITGVSAREMLEQLIQGQTEPGVLAELARGKLRKKIPELTQALEGKMAAHHRLIVSQLLTDMDWCEELIGEVSLEIAARLKEEANALARLDEIPGINQRMGEVILAEAGSDMSRFPTEGQFIAWSGFCPGNNQSGRRRRSGRVRPGDRMLKQVMMEAAHAAGRKKGSFFKAKYHRLAARRGAKRAKIAVGRTLLKVIYHVLKDGSHYKDLGQDFYERRNPEQLARKLARRIEKLGFAISLQKKELPAAA